MSFLILGLEDHGAYLYLHSATFLILGLQDHGYLLVSALCNILDIRVRGSWHIICLHPGFATFLELGLEDHGT